MNTNSEHHHGPAIPWRGLLAVLASYSGKGQVYNALAAVQGTEDVWSVHHVRRRARRILLAECMPLLARWPSSPDAWLNALPAQSVRHREVVTIPRGRVDWPRTRLTGWPPRQFAVSTRSRQPDEILATTFKWAISRLVEVKRDALIVLPNLDAPARRQLEAAEQVLALPPVSEATMQQPGRPELSAIRATGRPWTALTHVARLLLSEDDDLETLARRLLLPDDDLRWRLFHLGCLGQLITALHHHGCVVTGQHPLGVGGGPSYQAVDARGRHWDVWFEAGGMWSYYKVLSPYVAVTRGLPGASHPLGADLAVVLPGRHALLVECKYSPNPSYIGRYGYHQALSYLAEARSGLVEHAAAVVMGPEGVVRSCGTATTAVGTITIAPPSGLAALVAEALAGP